MKRQRITLTDPRQISRYQEMRQTLAAAQNRRVTHPTFLQYLMDCTTKYLEMQENQTYRPFQIPAIPSQDPGSLTNQIVTRSIDTAPSSPPSRSPVMEMISSANCIDEEDGGLLGGDWDDI